MLVGDKMVVSISYTLTNSEGEVMDQSPENEPLQYLHGAAGIIPGLENELKGKAVGSEFDVTISPEEAYGERIDEMVQVAPKSAFPADAELTVGMQFTSQTPDGQQIMVTITDISDDQITIDGNHPLAGLTLHFTGKIENIREASAEELDHGHAH